MELIDNHSNVSYLNKFLGGHIQNVRNSNFNSKSTEVINAPYYLKLVGIMLKGQLIYFNEISVLICKRQSHRNSDETRNDISTVHSLTSNPNKLASLR
jgi:hypothetical protein